MVSSKLVLGLGFLFILVSSNAYVGYKAYNLGSSKVQNEWNAFELERKMQEEKAAQEILKLKPKVKHENQNRDRDALIRHVCKRGWVRDPSQCESFR